MKFNVESQLLILYISNNIFDRDTSLNYICKFFNLKLNTDSLLTSSLRNRRNGVRDDLIKSKYYNAYFRHLVVDITNNSIDDYLNFIKYNLDELYSIRFFYSINKKHDLIEHLFSNFKFKNLKTVHIVDCFNDLTSVFKFIKNNRRIKNLYVQYKNYEIFYFLDLENIELYSSKLNDENIPNLKIIKKLKKVYIDFKNLEPLYNYIMNNELNWQTLYVLEGDRDKSSIFILKEICKRKNIQLNVRKYF